MPDDEFRVQTYLPLYAVGNFCFVPLYLAGMAVNGPGLVNVFGTALFLFFGVSTLAQARRPVLISDAGVRQRTLNWFRYDTTVPWSQVEHARLGKVGLVPAILLTLRDPAAIAAPGTALHRQFRRTYASTGGHVHILTPGWLNRTSRVEIEGAISLHSGGRILVEHALVDNGR